MSNHEDEQSTSRHLKEGATSTLSSSSIKKPAMTQPNLPTATSSTNTPPDTTSQTAMASKSPPKSKAVIHDQPGYTKEELIEQLNKIHGIKWLDWDGSGNGFCNNDG